MTILSRFAEHLLSNVQNHNRKLTYPVALVIVAVTYLIAGLFGLRFAILHDNVSLIWGALAIAFAALLLGGWKLWPGVALGAFLVNFTTGQSLPVVLLITCGNTLAPLVGFYLLRHVIPISLSLGRVKDIVVFALVGILASSLISSTIGTFALLAGNAIPVSSGFRVWLEWLMGDSIGILVLTPLILLWWQDHGLSKNYRKWLEFSTLSIAVAIVCRVVFWRDIFEVNNYPLSYLIIPFMLWAAFRFGARGASIICLIMASVAISGVIQQLNLAPYGNVHHDLIYLWGFTAIITSCTLMVSTTISDRKHIARELARERDYMAQLVNAMGHGVAVTDTDGRFEYVNPAYAQMLGLKVEELIGKIPDKVLTKDERAIVSNSALRLGPDFQTIYETRFHRQNLAPLDVLVTGSLRRNQGRVTGIITSVTDLSDQKKTEIALRQSEARLKSIINNMPFDLWVLDSDGRCILQTPKSIEMWGSLLGKTIDDMGISPETNQEWKRNNERIKNGETLKTDVTYSVKGEQRHFYAITSPVSDNQSVLGILGINVDITDVVQVQNALHKTESASKEFSERLKALQDVTIELARIEDFYEFCRQAIELGRSQLKFERLGLWLVDPDDPNFTIGTFGTDEFGNTRDERNVRIGAMGKEDVIPNTVNMVDIHDKKIYYNPDRPLLNDQSQPVGMGWAAMGHLIDGDRIIGGLSTDNFFSHEPAEPHQLELLALYSNVLGHLCILKRAESRLQSSEARFRSVFTGAKVGIALANAQGYFVSVNPSLIELLGYTESELLQMTFQQVTHPDDRSGTAILYQQFLAGEREFYQLEKRYMRKTGEYVWVRLNVSMFPAFDDARAIAIIEDIDARKRAEAEVQILTTNLEQRVADRTLELQVANERLTELDHLKTKFIADVTHELRTPLTVLATRVYLLQHAPPEKHPAYLLVLKEQLERLNNFVNATLDLSRLELAHNKIAFGSVDLNSVVNQVVIALQPRAEVAGLQIHLQTNALPKVNGELNQLAQVVTNLVANAINYTPTGSITIRTSHTLTSDHVTLEVIDTGMGISELDIPHLFTRFYRGERAGQTNIPGTGLGLSIVKEIVDLHEGQIRVTSQVGNGTAFTVTLPVYHKS